jgi:hypothetical protein
MPQKNVPVASAEIPPERNRERDLKEESQRNRRLRFARICARKVRAEMNAPDRPV